MEIILTAIDDGLLDAWKQFCGEFEFVSFHKGSILDVECDAVVSPANSFGFMDGGIDAVYLDYFVKDIQFRVRKEIYEFFGGELLVGQSCIVDTQDSKIPYLIAAPTMRVPMILRDSINPYLASRAIFRLIQNTNFLSGPHTGKPINEIVKKIAIPGLATGVGKVGPGTCAHQMCQAIKDFVLGQYEFPKSWAEASEKHQLLYTNHPTRLQY